MTIEEVVIAFLVMSPVFTAATPEHFCRHPNITMVANCSSDIIKKLTLPHGDASKCSYLKDIPLATLAPLANTECNFTVPEGWNNGSTQTCTEWVYDTSLYDSTIVSQWNLVCDDAWKRKLVSSVYLAGMTVGCLTFGWLSDRLGRRKTSFLAGIPNVIIGFASAFVTNFYVLIALRFFHGAFSIGKTMVGLVIAMEFSGMSWRVNIGSMYSISWAIGYMLIGLIAYAIPNWRYLMIICSTPEIVYYILLYLFVPETPRWLYANQRSVEAERVVRRMAQVNRKPELPENLQVTVKADCSKNSPVTPLDLLRTRHVRMVTLILAFVWAANGFSYYGLSLSSSELAGNPYVNFIIGGAIEIPAYIFIMLVFPLLGRIWPFALCMISSGVALLLIVLVPPGFPIVVTTLAMTGKFFITVTFTMVSIYTPEVYPTSVRAIGIMYNNLMSKLGASVASFVTLLVAVNPVLPNVIYGLAAVLAGLALIPMPETRGQPMSQNISEAEIILSQAPTGATMCCRRGKRGRGGVGSDETNDGHETLSMLDNTDKTTVV